jgi:hypothetical protein
MDIVSHGLWGGVAFGRKKKSDFYLAFFFGILPDLLSFGVHTIAIFLGLSPRIDWSHGHPSMDEIPAYVHNLYNVSHSLVIFTIVFTMIWVIRKKTFLPFLAYGLHLLVDIPTHSTKFFATPFLWPLSDYRFNGWQWGQPMIFIPNVVLLFSAYIIWFIAWKKKKTQAMG